MFCFSPWQNNRSRSPTNASNDSGITIVGGAGSETGLTGSGVTIGVFGATEEEGFGNNKPPQDIKRKKHGRSVSSQF